jgi:hypothetical protein
MPPDVELDARCSPSSPTGDGLAERLRRWWSAHGPAVLRLAIVLLVVLAIARLAIELWLLLGEPTQRGGVDLRARHEEVAWWFSDLPVWRNKLHAGYPPASFVMLWPLLGWLGFTPVRWLWALLNLGMLGLAVRFALRESGARYGWERRFLVLLLLASYPIPVTFGNGQLGLLALGAMLAALFLLEEHAVRPWHRDLHVAGLLLGATVKPSLTAPFFLIVLFRGRGLRPLLLAAAGYAALTALAMAYRSRSLLAELRAFLEPCELASGLYGHAHLPMWLAALGHPVWSTWASLAALLALTVWVVKHSRGELWPLLGVTSIAGRIATYHGSYDDTMTLLALLALWRLTRPPRAPGARDVIASVLLALTIPPLLAPVTMSRMVLPWSLVHQVFQPLVWLATMVFLAAQARPSRTGSAATAS